MGGAEGGTALADYLAASGALHEVDRGLEKLQVFLIVRCVCAVDLDPFPRAGHTAGLERGDVLPGKLQLGRDGDGQAQAHAVGADAGEHLVADEIGVQPADLPGADARELEQHCVDPCLAAGLGCLGFHGRRVWVVLHRKIESQTPGVRCVWPGREKAAAACEYGEGLGRRRRVEANNRAGLGRWTYRVLPVNCPAAHYNAARLHEEMGRKREAIRITARTGASYRGSRESLGHAKGLSSCTAPRGGANAIR